MTVQMLDEKSGRRPGPLPTLGPIGLVDDTPDEAGRPGAGLEHFLGRLQVWFALVLSVSLPFIVYVLCSKGGFDLTVVTYPVLGAAMATVTAIGWTRSELGGRVRDVAPLRWLAVQSIPVAGFLLWRFGASGFYRSIPLIAVTWVFVATVNPLRTPAPR
jgi:hypothetical protein